MMNDEQEIKVITDRLDQSASNIRHIFKEIKEIKEIIEDDCDNVSAMQDVLDHLFITPSDLEKVNLKLTPLQTKQILNIIDDC